MTADHGIVYRAEDRSAEQDATAIKNLLMEAGLGAVLVDDTNVGVEPGTFEVRVPASEMARAEELIAEANRDDYESADPSPELDTVPVIETQGATGEMEALAVQSILDANGINALLVGSSTLPNFSFQVRVAQEDLARAEAVLAEARAAGPAAAAEAERESELDG